LRFLVVFFAFFFLAIFRLLEIIEKFSNRPGNNNRPRSTAVADALNYRAKKNIPQSFGARSVDNFLF